MIYNLTLSSQNPPEKEIDAQGTSVTNKKDRKSKDKAKDGKKEGSDDNENVDDYGRFPFLFSMMESKESEQNGFMCIKTAF